MITDSYSKMMSDIGMRSMVSNTEELGLLMREKRRQDASGSDREMELNMYRSGSAPPTVEGSLNAVAGLFDGGGGGNGLSAELGGISEEELRSDPAYLSYYYSNVNLNPRLPPPLLSKEDWRFSQRLHGGGGGGNGSSAIGDRRNMSKRQRNRSRERERQREKSRDRERNRGRGRHTYLENVERRSPERRSTVETVAGVSIGWR